MTSSSTTPPTPIAASPNRRPFTSADGGRAKPAAMIGPGKMRDVAPGGVDSGSNSTNRATDSAKLFSAPLWPVVLVASPGPPLPRRVRQWRSWMVATDDYAEPIAKRTSTRIRACSISPA